MLDELNEFAFVISVFVTVVMVYSMFFWNPEYWSIVPFGSRLVVAIAAPVVAYFVSVKMLE